MNFCPSKNKWMGERIPRKMRTHNNNRMTTLRETMKKIRFRFPMTCLKRKDMMLRLIFRNWALLSLLQTLFYSCMSRNSLIPSNPMTISRRCSCIPSDSTKTYSTFKSTKTPRKKPSSKGLSNSLRARSMISESMIPMRQLMMRSQLRRFVREVVLQKSAFRILSRRKSQLPSRKPPARRKRISVQLRGRRVPRN